ncbi:uncharacterized protein LOC121521708 [Cheilinus undulatus]|uniref:uncharacterized protein LOC121521708 n=1 Tax=Cheilinus undulatus TaxID=241271 RepID=UPI001BD2A39F|nr:uncharacterized protein LOC121521708 [Cheilinus undulatus]
MGLKWIHLFGFLTALPQFTAKADGVKDLFITAKFGDDATLACENVLKDQPNCSSTTWMGSFKRNSVELIKNGKIVEKPGSKSDRLAVREDCSLVIKKVTYEAISHYSCQQYTSGRKQGDDTHVHLSVLTMTEISNNPKRLRCYVLSSLCVHTVKWLYEGRDVVENAERSSELPCFTDLTLQPHHNIDSLQCEVTADGNRQLFPFRPPTSGDKPDNDNRNSTRPTTTPKENTPPGTTQTASEHEDSSKPHVTEISKKPKRLRCYVISKQHINTVKWLYEGRDVDKRTSQTHCYTDLTLQPHHNIDSLQCEVTADDNHQLFPFRPPSSEDKPDKDNRLSTRPTTTPKENTPPGTTQTASEHEDSSKPHDCSGCSALDVAMFALRVAELLMVSVLTHKVTRRSPPLYAAVCQRHIQEHSRTDTFGLINKQQHPW